ncbi:MULTISPECIES: hypothetical protein [Rhodomicrobium]|uniref:hypothetical protein n=1 Tax=Rhodomicrobium TaxID=1068 RepID=UPI000B4BC2CE|nr:MULTISPECIES: hypothetical protein [Rhodomicrobium]
MGAPVFGSVSAELTEAIAMMAERTTRTGEPWCPPRVSAAIRRAIIDRSEDLGRYVHQSMRFARLAALCAPRGYVDFLYGAVPALRAEAFRTAIRAAGACGTPTAPALRIGQDGIVLLEPAMATRNGAGFEIAYAQMPALAAFLDVLHNTLGYAEIAGLLAPITGLRAEPAAADEVTRLVRSRLNGWLSPRLEAAHRREQAKRIHEFLAHRQAVLPEAIDDGMIFDFWLARAGFWRGRMDSEAVDRAKLEKLARDEGFRVFRSAARLMLRYRQALLDAVAERRMGSAQSLTRSADGEDDRTTIEIADGAPLEPVEPWISPLAELARPPANRIKWLTARETRHLRNYLGMPPETAAGPDPDEEESQGGIFERAAFDLAFSRTLLRVDVLGGMQADLIARLKKRMPPAEALEAARPCVTGDSYREAAGVYAETRDQLRLEGLAALDILGSGGDAAAMLLAEHFGGVDAAAALGGAPADRCEIGSKLATLFSGAAVGDTAVTALLAEARRSRARVNRDGFRKQDLADGAATLAYRASVMPLIALHRALGRLCDRLGGAPFLEEAEADRDRFLAGLELIYGQANTNFAADILRPSD